MKSVNAGWNAISSWRSRSKRCDRSGGPNPRLYVHPTQHERHGYAELACRTLLTSLQVPFLHCVLTLPLDLYESLFFRVHFILYSLAQMTKHIY